MPPQQQRRIFLLGHSHLDLAWLWPIDETWEVAQRTFESVLKLQQEFPNLTYCHSSPALYAWIEQHRPDLFVTIQQQLPSRSKITYFNEPQRRVRAASPLLRSTQRKRKG